ncbi:hypothetical protein GJ744_002866 [Endocarpon pusillum]|uniref:RBR-type E3 ubiquitin transferase n=1 Tax=Endocarpon pusillum TaxID=364733 RepID=A0A8H7ABC6_9EURO|nr:hypothetical protein GJ744_002866 [Endocarpon pusillum]
MASDGQRGTVHNDATCPSSRRRTNIRSRPRKDKKETRAGRNSTPVKSPADAKPADLEALRRARLDYIDTSAGNRTEKMKYVGETTTREAVKANDVRHVRQTSAVKRRRKVVDSDRKHVRRKVRNDQAEAGDYQPVYDDCSRELDIEARKDDVEGKESDGDEHTDVQIKAPSQSRRQTIDRCTKGGNTRRFGGQDAAVEKQRETCRRRQSEPIGSTHHAPRNSCGIDERKPAPSERNTPSRQSPHVARPSLRRSATTIRSKPDATLTTSLVPTRAKNAPSTAGSHAKKGSGILSNLLRSTPATQSSLKKVTCLTCGSDEPIIKTAKLACTHRMCHGCLRRIFTMSVGDPAHMPPKCCTSEHIPLKYVDKLFDQKFKKTWNRKFHEYSTRDRIYCPSRQCGEWIKPNHINVENGRKVGKCKRCGTRVCCVCNNKMHTSRECPKDPEANAFAEVAKKEGWQRCFNCSAMVELKEGCNHMTCRCTAEFCMICGNKWKTCDCPWFNYEAVEADRLQHMDMAQGRRVYDDEDGRAPIRYQEELDRRRHQERRDEALARRMQVLGVDDDPSDDIVADDNPGQLLGVGNAAEHFLNHDFRQQARGILTGNFRQAARAAERLLNGAVTGRENPLPPGPFELDAPAGTTTNQTVQLLRHNTAFNTAWNNAARAGLNDQGNPRRRNGNIAANRATNDPAEEIIPLPATLPNAARRPAVRNINRGRQAGGLEDLLAADRLESANESTAEQRIENWRSEVPVGQPADGVALV